MYAGHFAIGLAIASRAPRKALVPVLAGVGLMDFVNGLLIVAGADRVKPDLASGPYLFFDLVFIDWDHSLLMALLLSAAWGLLFFARDRQVGALAAAAAFSHFLADWPVHNGDLALFPFAQQHLGYGLWGRWGTGAWVAEGVFAAALLACACQGFARRSVDMRWPLLLMAVLFISLSPWLSPMRIAAQLGEPVAHLMHGSFVASGFALPTVLLWWLLKRQPWRPAAASS
jgi:hypothetical protein